jgi:hypothetical protein
MRFRRFQKGFQHFPRRDGPYRGDIDLLTRPIVNLASPDEDSDRVHQVVLCPQTPVCGQQSSEPCALLDSGACKAASEGVFGQGFLLKELLSELRRIDQFVDEIVARGEDAGMPNWRLESCIRIAAMTRCASSARADGTTPWPSTRIR